MSNEAQLTTRDLGEVENALRANLAKILARSNPKLGYGHWAALQIISKSPAPLSQAQLSSQLAGALKVDHDTVEMLLGELVSEGIITVKNDVYDLTLNGKSVLNDLNTQAQKVTAQTFSGIDPGDLIVAHRVVTSIANRASELLAD